MINDSDAIGGNFKLPLNKNLTLFKPIISQETNNQINGQIN